MLDVVGGVAQHAVQQRRLPRLKLLPDHFGGLMSQLPKDCADFKEAEGVCEQVRISCYRFVIGTCGVSCSNRLLAFAFHISNQAFLFCNLKWVLEDDVVVQNM